MTPYKGEGFYEKLGVKPAINGFSWVTIMGGSIMPPPVVRAMEEASKFFVDMHILNTKAGEVIARLTGAEAGLVTAGSAAGMLLQATACMTGTDPVKVNLLPDTRSMKNQIVLHRTHHVGFVRTYRAAGARLVEIGDMDHTEEWELEMAIGPKTAAVAYVYGPKMAGAIPLERVVEIAHARGVPVIVDAAAMLPPVENLTRYVAAGADMVSFSGGKGVLGPQSTGILCGRKALIEAAYMNSAPNSEGVGRPAKVTKEEIAGIITALEIFVDTDQEVQRADWRNKCQVIVSGLEGIAGVTTTLVEARPELQDSRSGHATAIVRPDTLVTGLTDDDVIARLKEGNPPIYVGSAGPEGGIAIVPVNLRDGEAEIVTERLRGILAGS